MLTCPRCTQRVSWSVQDLMGYPYDSVLCQCRNALRFFWNGEFYLLKIPSCSSVQPRGPSPARPFLPRTAFALLLGFISTARSWCLLSRNNKTCYYNLLSHSLAQPKTISSPSNCETMLMGFLHVQSRNGKHVQRLPGQVSILDLTLYLVHQGQRSW